MGDYNEIRRGTFDGIMGAVKVVVSIAILGAASWFLFRNFSSIAYVVVAIYKSHPIVFVLVTLAIVLFGAIHVDGRDNKKIKAGDQQAIEGFHLQRGCGGQTVRANGHAVPHPRNL